MLIKGRFLLYLEIDFPSACHQWPNRQTLVRLPDPLAFGVLRSGGYPDKANPSQGARPTLLIVKPGKTQSKRKSEARRSPIVNLLKIRLCDYWCVLIQDTFEKFPEHVQLCIYICIYGTPIYVIRKMWHQTFVTVQVSTFRKALSRYFLRTLQPPEARSKVTACKSRRHIPKLSLSLTFPHLVNRTPRSTPSTPSWPSDCHREDFNGSQIWATRLPWRPFDQHWRLPL